MPATFSFIVFLVLTTVFVASFLVFWQLERRATSHRQWVSFKEWGRTHAFRLRRSEKIPQLLLVENLGASARIALTNRTTTILQIETAPAGDPTGAAPNAEPRRWNLLIRAAVPGWPATALRPAHQASSLVDLLSLQNFPLLGPTERFIVHGSDTAAARKLSKSSARSLLPPDIGMILKADDLVLDFSSRPFDTIEFERMLAVADQLTPHLRSIA